MSEINPLRVIAKGLAIFVFLNVAFAVLNPPVGQLSIYNWLVKGRQRFPRGSATYNVAPEDLNAVFASHEISGAGENPAQYRVIVLGDSSVWGPLLSTSENLIGQLNDIHLVVCGRQARFFNLGYPMPNALKDFVILSRAREYKPTLVIWMLAPTSVDMKATPPVWGSESSKTISALLHEYGLDRYQKFIVPPPTFWERTLIGQRRRLARLARLQMDGLLWGATGIDDLRLKYQPVDETLVPVPSTVPDQGDAPAVLDPATHAFGVLAAARRMMGSIQVLIVNEPIFLATTPNLKDKAQAIDLWRNYHLYRQQLQESAADAGWPYIDLSDSIPPREFTNGIHHVNAAAERRIAHALAREIQSLRCP